MRARKHVRMRRFSLSDARDSIPETERSSSVLRNPETPCHPGSCNIYFSSRSLSLSFPGFKRGSSTITTPYLPWTAASLTESGIRQHFLAMTACATGDHCCCHPRLPSRTPPPVVERNASRLSLGKARCLSSSLKAPKPCYLPRCQAPQLLEPAQRVLDPSTRSTRLGKLQSMLIIDPCSHVPARITSCLPVSTRTSPASIEDPAIASAWNCSALYMTAT